MTVGAFLMVVLVKPALVIGLASVIARGVHRHGASARHGVWAGAIAATLVLPLCELLLPAERLPAVELPAATPPLLLRALDTDRVARSHLASSSASRDEGRTSRRHAFASPSVGDIVVGVWAAVALLLVAKRIAAEFAAHRMVRRSLPIPRATASRITHIADRCAVRAPDVRMSELMPFPAVAGIVHPTLLLPVAAASWSESELESIVIHELGHIRRRDCLTSLFADLAGALYWCNPAVRFAVHRLGIESERACDDLVLRSGVSGASYARLLVRVASGVNDQHGVPCTVTPMARPSELETRVLAVLDEREPRPPGRSWIAGSVAVVVMTLALPAAALTVTVTSADAEPAVSQAQEPDQRGDSMALPSSERVPLPAGAPRQDDRFGALRGRDSALAVQLLAATQRAPQHESDLVAERAMWALQQVRGGQLVEPLLESLDSRDWRVQAYAAWSLMVAHERRAVPRLIPLMRHDAWRLRAMAAAALRHLEDPRATDAMRGALADDAWQVRLEAVEYLAELDPSTFEPLLQARLEDRHIAVRNAAARALH